METFKDFATKFNIGVIGFSDESQYNNEEAKMLIKTAFDQIEEDYPDKNYYVVSGLTKQGIPHLAYKEAVKRDWKTVGVSAKEAEQYELFEVDVKTIVGEKFGDESQYFINEIDILVKVGGGKQSKKELDMAKDHNIKVYEYEFEKDD